MFVRVVVLARAVMNLAAWVTAFDLDRRVSDCKATTEPALQVAHDVLGFAERALLQDYVSAERHLFR